MSDKQKLQEILREMLPCYMAHLLGVGADPDASELVQRAKKALKW